MIGIVGRDGAFADLVAIPERNLHAVPEAVDDDTAVFTEPVAAAFQIPAQISIRRDDRIVVLGDGRLGNLCAQVLARLSDRVVVVGKHARKLEILEKMGIRTRLRGAPEPSTAAGDGPPTSSWIAPDRRPGSHPLSPWCARVERSC